MSTRGCLSRRGTSNGNVRGSSYARRRRRARLVEELGIPRKSDGKKTRIPCVHCGKVMKADGIQWEVDRFPVCGVHGGRYVRGNIVPSCPPCNKRRCKHDCRFGSLAMSKKARATMQRAAWRRELPETVAA
jgi:hypothetical protein